MWWRECCCKDQYPSPVDSTYNNFEIWTPSSDSRDLLTHTYENPAESYTIPPYGQDNGGITLVDSSGFFYGAFGRVHDSSSNYWTTKAFYPSGAPYWSVDAGSANASKRIISVGSRLLVLSYDATENLIFEYTQSGSYVKTIQRSTMGLTYSYPIQDLFSIEGQTDRYYALQQNGTTWYCQVIDSATDQKMSSAYYLCTGSDYRNHWSADADTNYIFTIDPTYSYWLIYDVYHTYPSPIWLAQFNFSGSALVGLAGKYLAVSDGANPATITVYRFDDFNASYSGGTFPTPDTAPQITTLYSLLLDTDQGFKLLEDGSGFVTSPYADVALMDGSLVARVTSSGSIDYEFGPVSFVGGGVSGYFVPYTFSGGKLFVNKYTRSDW